MNNRNNLWAKGSKKKPDTCLSVTEPVELMTFLLAELPKKGRNNIKSLLSHRQVLVNKKVVTQFNHRLKAGDKVIINWSLVRDESKNNRDLKIIYEDDSIIVIDKPAGLLSMASNKEKVRTAYHMLTDYVRRSEENNRIFIVHRLDRDTSGIMLFAKNEEVKRALQDNWKVMVTDRAYVAVVEGEFKIKKGSVKSWLKETSTRLVYSSGKAGEGQEAITHYEVLQATPLFSLLEIRLETGRKNQIRVHMQDMGHSIVGDRKYGAKESPIRRLALHAHILAFKHPVTGEDMRFETEIPKSFTRLLAK